MITNISKPTTSVTNTTKANLGETWASILTSWASETKTWASVSTLMANISVGITGFLWTLKRTPWTETSPWTVEGGITNTSKPI